MKLAHTIGASLLLLATAVPSMANGVQPTGADISIGCGIADNNWCNNYVVGVASGMQMYTDYVCFPEAVPGLAMAKAVAAFINAHPEMLAKPAGIAVASALIAIYPCKTI